MSRSEVTVDLAYLNSLEDDAKKYHNLKPYGWGIVDKAGDPVIGTCIQIHGDVTDLKELATTWNERGNEAFRVVQLFYKDES